MEAFAIKVTYQSGEIKWAKASGSFSGAEWSGFAMHATREDAEHWASLLNACGVPAEVVRLEEATDKINVIEGTPSK